MTIAHRLYRMSLRLLPGDLRQDFGDDMMQLFSDELTAASGWIGRVRLFFAAIADVVMQSRAAKASGASQTSVAPGHQHAGSRRRGTGLASSPLSNFPHDIRHGLRLIRRYPGTAAVAIATLAIGIGANTAIFSVVDSVLLRALPYPQPSQLVTIYEARPREHVTNNVASAPDFLDWRRTSQAFSSMTAMTGNIMSLSGSGEPVDISAALVSSGFFDVLGVQPFMGRGFSLDEEQRGKHRVAVLTYELWKRQFNGDPDIVGKTVIFTGNPWHVIGVMPESFVFFEPEYEMFVPLSFGAAPSRGSHSFEVFARMKPGVTLARAHDEMDRISHGLEAQYPDDNTGHYANVESLQSSIVSDVRSSLTILSIAVGLVLLLASVNVANLMLVRSAKREREMAVRAALGADRWRLMTQSFAECLTLGTIGGALGVALAALLMRALPLVLPEQLSVVRTADLHLDLRILAGAAGITLFTSLIFGLLPALHASRGDVVEPLKQGGRGAATIGRGVRVALIVSEVTLASLTLIGAGLIVRSFSAVASQPLGIDPHHRVAFGLATPQARYPTEQLRLEAMLRLEQQLAAIPGVSTVGAIDVLPLSGDDIRRGVVIEGRDPVPDAPTRMHPRIVSPSYFHASGMTMLRGRALTENDTAASPLVSVVNQTAAKVFWPNADPVGKRWRMDGEDGRWVTIVGVTDDVRHWGLSKPANPMVFMPMRQNISGEMTFVAKTDLDEASFAASARATVHALDPNMPLGNVRSLDSVVARSLQSKRAVTILMSTFGLLALLLASIGIYGVMSQLVASRVQEIGVRMALGAGRSHILADILRGCVLQTLVGITVGGSVAVVSMSATTFLFGVKAWDVLTLSVVAGTILGASLLACLVPAVRAIHVNPVTAMRQ